MLQGQSQILQLVGFHGLRSIANALHVRDDQTTAFDLAGRAGRSYFLGDVRPRELTQNAGLGLTPIGKGDPSRNDLARRGPPRRRREEGSSSPDAFYTLNRVVLF